MPVNFKYECKRRVDESGLLAVKQLRFSSLFELLYLLIAVDLKYLSIVSAFELHPTSKKRLKQHNRQAKILFSVFIKFSLKIQHILPYENLKRNKIT